MPVSRRGVFPDLTKVLSIARGKILEALFELGRIAIQTAEESHEFQNRTFNLEDSYAFGVYEKGSLVGDIEIRQPKATSREGYNAGIDFLKKQNPEGDFALIVTAGMWYGSIVQDYYLFDVLEESEFVVERLAPKIFQNMKLNKI